MEGVPTCEVSGIIHTILPPVRYGRNREKQTFLLLTDTPSPQLLPIEVSDQLLALFRQVPLHARVKVRFALLGQLWHPPQGNPKPLLRLLAIDIKRLTD